MKAIHGVAKVLSLVNTVAAMIPGPLQPLAAASAVFWGGIAGVTASKKPGAPLTGSPTELRLDPQAPVPYVIGRTYFGGMLVHQDEFGTDNLYTGLVIVWSGGGPIEEIEAFQADRTTITFSSGAATGTFAGYMWLDTQLGDCPEATALVSSQGTLPGWDSASDLSGYAAGLLTLKWDTKGVKYPAGFPQFGTILKGAMAYDPRLDSTYPGGSGAHRSNNEATWEYSENPWLHAITYALGRFQNGERVLGPGMPVDSIILRRYVEAANVADANGWKVGGVVTTADDKWNVLKLIAQAGGGEPIRLGGSLSCDFQTPRVSLATVTAFDLVGSAKVTGTQARRERFNTAIARFRSEDHGWEIVPADEISVSAYVTDDGGKRSQEIDLPLVQDVDQAAQLATYEIVNAREFGPITLALGPKWIGYKPGDCLTLTVDELGLSAQKAVITRRSLDPETGVVELELKSETNSKHAFALGQTGTAPPTPTLTPGGTALIDVTIDSPVVSRLNPDTGTALATFIDDQGRAFSQLGESGSARDGDVVTFGTTLPSVPAIAFLPAGNAAVAGQNIVIQAVGITTSGFTMKAVSQSVTAGSTITDGSASAGSGAEPDLVINRTNAGVPFDGVFSFRYTVTVDEIAPGEPGYVRVGIFVKQSGTWNQIGSRLHSASGTYDFGATPGTVDFGAGNEFGVSLIASEGPSSALSSFTHVKYSLGTVTETSLTPAGASPIPWLAVLG